MLIFIVDYWNITILTREVYIFPDLILETAVVPHRRRWHCPVADHSRLVKYLVASPHSRVCSHTLRSIIYLWRHRLLLQWSLSQTEGRPPAAGYGVWAPMAFGRGGRSALVAAPLRREMLMSYAECHLPEPLGLAARGEAASARAAVLPVPTELARPTSALPRPLWERCVSRCVSPSSHPFRGL